ncbi:MAG: glycosyltransferase family 1 protein [Alphaproteobacteria bacterium]|nr:glycosyltransferase family 1 protein [Alphaproteobacteria bacterium]
MDSKTQQPVGQRSRRSESRPLRVAFVASSYNYIKDGVALTLNRLVAYLERQGVEVLIFAPVGKAPAFAHHGTVVPVPSVPLPARPEYRLAFGLPHQAVEKLRAFQPDIIHVALAPDVLGYSALRVAQSLNIPVVASYHTRFETYLKHYWYVASLTGVVRYYLRRSYSVCREVYVPSQSMIDALLADGFRNNFRLWPRGVDTSRFSPGKRSSLWRAKHGIGENELAVVFVSRLVREKQLGTLVAALRLLEERHIAYRSVIVGDGPERAALERQLPHAVFTGFLEGDELAEAYASSDIFVFPSETETFGNVTLEAMASGLPCVCADATGSRSLVAHGHTGYLARPGCAQDFAGHLVTLARDAELRRQMGASAHARSLEFSWDETMARVHGYYKSLLAEPLA